MADRAQILAEAAKRGILPPELKGEYERLRASGAIGKGAAAQGNTNFDNETSLRKEFTGRKEVSDFVTVLPQLASAMDAPETGAGDLSIIYAFGKIMDPGSVVREGELSLAQQTASLPEQLQQFVGRIRNGERLAPEVRKHLVLSMRNRAQSLAAAYNQARGEFTALAERKGIAPEDIVGAHPALPFQGAEAAFLGRPVRNLDGSHGAAPPMPATPAAGGSSAPPITGAAGAALPPPAPAPTTPEQMDATIKSMIEAQRPASEIREYLASVGSGLNERDQAVMGEYDAAIAAGQSPQIGVRTQEPSTAMGFVKGAAHPFDRAAVGLENGANWLLGTNSTEAADVAAKRDGYFAGMPVNETAEDVGKFAGAALLTRGLGGPVTQGALGNVLMGDADTAGGVVTDAVVGGVGGKAGDLAFRGASRVIAPRVDQSVRNLASEGVAMSPGQIIGGRAQALEDKATSLPIVGDAILASRDTALDGFNRAMINRTLRPIGEKLPANVKTGHDAVKYANERLSAGYEAVLPQITATPDKTFATRLAAVKQRANLAPADAQALDELVQREITSRFTQGQNTLRGRDYKAIDERLSDLAAGFRASDDPYKRQLGAAVADIKDQFGALVRRQNPKQAARLRQLDQGYAQFARVRDATSRSVDDGIATPGELRSAVRQGDRSVGKGATARGDALMQDLAIDASKVLPAKTGSSGTTERANLTDVKAWLAGAALSPLYKPAAQRTLAQIALAPRPAAAKSIADLLELAPSGLIGATFLNSKIAP